MICEGDSRFEWLSPFCIESAHATLRFISSLGEVVIHLSKQTNDISRTYLYHAARGQVSSRLVALAEAISRGESGEALLPTAESAMCVGHSSCTDAVTGLLFGLATWDTPVLAAKIIRPDL